MESFDVIELNLGDVRHIDNLLPLLLCRLKFLRPLGKSLLLPLKLLVSSLLIVMKNIVQQAEFYLNLIKLDVVIMNHRVLLF